MLINKSALALCRPGGQYQIKVPTRGNDLEPSPVGRAANNTSWFNLFLGCKTLRLTTGLLLLATAASCTNRKPQEGEDTIIPINPPIATISKDHKLPKPIVPEPENILPKDIAKGERKKTLTPEERKALLNKLQDSNSAARLFSTHFVNLRNYALPAVVKVCIPRPGEKDTISTGIIYTSDGYIITANHGTKEKNEVTIEFSNGKKTTGKVIGRNIKFDIAVIKVDLKDLPTLSFAKDDPEPCELGLLIGNPHGYEFIATLGIISGNRTNITMPNDVEITVIPIDTAVNRGSSGGPLLNPAGEISGVVIALRNDAQNLSFVLPPDTAKTVADRLIQNFEK